MVLSSIRKRSGLLILVIGVAMLGFLLTDLMSSGASLFQKGQNILLKVDNVEIDIQKFEKDLAEWEQFNRLFSRNSPDRNDFFDQELDRILLQSQLDKSHISVGSLESWDLISGEITTNQTPTFSGWFREQDESGSWNQYDPDMIRSWIDIGVDHGPNWTNYKILKKTVIRQRESQKYLNAIKKGLYITTSEAELNYVEQNVTHDGNYLMIPYSSSKIKIQDVSNEEIENYYQSNLSEFPNEPNREVTYYAFNLDPSKEDKEGSLAEIADILNDRVIFNKNTKLKDTIPGFFNTNDLLSFFNENADNKYNEQTISNKDLELLTSKYPLQNAVIGPYIDDEICKISRIISQDNDSTIIVTLERVVYPSNQTLNLIYSTVHDFMSNNNTNIEFEESAKKMSIRPRTVSMSKMDESVAGIGPARSIVKWAFNDETSLYASQYFDFPEQYVVAVLSNVLESDTRIISDVENIIKQKLEKANQVESITKKIAVNNFSLKDISQMFNVKVQSLNKLTFNSKEFGLDGYNALAIGTLVGIDLGKLSKPIIGNNGVIVLSKSKESDINFPSNISNYSKLIKTEYDSQVDLNLMESLKNEVEIIDNRFNFY